MRSMRWGGRRRGLGHGSVAPPSGRESNRLDAMNDDPILRAAASRAERAEIAALEARVLELERVVADYAERYGLTERARGAMIGVTPVR